jgi:hypothetical protein
VWWQAIKARDGKATWWLLSGPPAVDFRSGMGNPALRRPRL